MTYEEMKKYIADMVKSQGSQGAIEQPGGGTITITVHPDVNNDINNNSSWGDVRALLQEKTYITIKSATA